MRRFNGLIQFGLGRPGGWLGVVIGVVLLGIGGGCSTASKPQLYLMPQYKPSNVFALESHMPSPIRRVAVLPITADSDDWEAVVGAGNLEGVLRTELGEAKMFELVVLTPAQLRGWTGQPTWRSDEGLPPDFFDQLRAMVDCDAVLFTHLTSYHPYRPIVVGWNMKLVESNQQHILWSVDEVFDASEARVATSAEIYDREHSRADYNSVDRSVIMLSPRKFARYTLDAIFDTLPPR